MTTSPPKWSQEEMRKLAEMRKILQPQLEKRRQLPDVVGDRRLLRFLRGHGTVEKACQYYSKFLKFRDQYDVDSIRDDVLYGGMTSQYDLPHGRKVFTLLPQTMVSAEALDKNGNPVALEYFNFQPDLVLKELPKPDYIKFIIYTLEYKILMCEQLAHEREKAFLARQQQSGKPITAPYGLMPATTVIRDLNGFGVAHVGSDGQTVMKWIMEIAGDNYPELLAKGHMINVPWIFNSIWWFVKNLMDPNTLKKLSITGTDYMKTLQQDIPITSIPVAIGGKFVPKEELFKFDTSESGPFYYPGCENEIHFEDMKNARMQVNQAYQKGSKAAATTSTPTQQQQIVAAGSPTAGAALRGAALQGIPGDRRSNASGGTHFTVPPYAVRNGMISTISTESVLLDALSNRQVKVSHILQMRHPSQRQVEGFLEGRRRRQRESRYGDAVPPGQLDMMRPQKRCQSGGCSIM